jgi:hypothetical protein
MREVGSMKEIRNTEFWPGSLKTKNHLGHVDIRQRIILK